MHNVQFISETLTINTWGIHDLNTNVRMRPSKATKDLSRQDHVTNYVNYLSIAQKNRY